MYRPIDGLIIIIIIIIVEWIFWSESSVQNPKFGLIYWEYFVFQPLKI